MRDFLFLSILVICLFIVCSSFFAYAYSLKHAQSKNKKEFTGYITNQTKTKHDTSLVFYFVENTLDKAVFSGPITQEQVEIAKRTLDNAITTSQIMTKSRHI